jgi:lipid-A-disaccharide synthase
MKYFLIAGEASGDLHASRIMKELTDRDPEAQFMFLGGDRMEETAPGGLVRHYRDMNIMGIFAVVFRLGFFLKLLSQTRHQIERFGPDGLILVDYAGFNLRIARYAASRNIPVLYYIAPKVWAWRKGRIQSMKRYIHRLFVIFPFEPRFFMDHGMEVSYHGNPLVDDIRNFRERHQHAPVQPVDAGDHRPVIALLAGSRKQEIARCLPVMLKVAAQFPHYHFIVAGAPSVDPVYYRKYLSGSAAGLVHSKTYELLMHAHAALVTSGTATLETALFDVPQAVVYKTGWLTYGIGKLFVKLRFFGLVNLVYGDELVAELLQTNLERRLADETKRLLDEPAYRERIRSGYREIRNQFGEPGAAGRIAVEMMDLLEKKRM